MAEPDGRNETAGELRHALQLLHHAPDYILELDREGRILYMNRAPTGYELDDVIGLPVTNWLEPDTHEDFQAALAEVFGGAEVSSYATVGAVTGRSYVHRLSPVSEGGEVVRAILISHDVTELERARAELAEAEERYRTMVEASFEGLLLSVEGVVVDGNRAMATMFGAQTIEELRGLGPPDMVTPESVPVVIARIRSGSEEPYQVEGLRRDGSRYPLEIRGRNITIGGKAARLTAVRDLTESRRTEAEQARREERVRHAQKLETLGVLSGGVAHDFNNILAAVLANAEIALQSGPEVAHRSLERIRDAALRARGLTNQLLVYAGRGTRTVERVDLNALIDDTTQLLSVSISKKAVLVVDRAPDLPAVDADISQLSQVLVNLITNASDALGEEAGNITVRTRRVEVDPARLNSALAGPGARPGSYAQLEVIDTGSGLSIAQQARIFDPFFTTKFAGRGLGLASVLGIVRAHGGLVEVISVPGSGSIFRVLLPVASGSTPALPERVGVSSARFRGGLLLADDEPGLLQVAREVLERVGFTVHVARDGEEALEQLMMHGDGLVGALIDVTMPRRNGLEVVTELRQRWPRLPVVLMSGYTEADVGEQPNDLEHTVFLRKPFELVELTDALQRAGVAAISEE